MKNHNSFYLSNLCVVYSDPSCDQILRMACESKVKAYYNELLTLKRESCGVTTRIRHPPSPYRKFMNIVLNSNIGYKLTRKYSAWVLRSQEQKLISLVGICKNAGARGLIRQCT